MKLYYIDESMFQKSHFSIQVMYRFKQILAKSNHSIVFISVTGETNKNIEQFIAIQENTTVLLSPMLFDYASIRGNLHTTFLAIEEFPVMESYSGSCVEYDTDSKQVRRLYLEFFIQHNEQSMDNIVKEMEDLLNEKIQFLKKKLIMS